MMSLYSGLRFCFSGIRAAEDRDDLAELVVANGGHYSDDLLDTTTHLVLGKVGSAKHAVAVGVDGITIVVGDYIRDCVASGLLLESDAYHPAPLYGVRFLVLAAAEAVRSATERRIRELGGSATPIDLLASIRKASLSSDTADPRTSFCAQFGDVAPLPDAALLIEHGAMDVPDTAPRPQHAAVASAQMGSDGSDTPRVQPVRSSRHLRSSARLLPHASISGHAGPVVRVDDPTATCGRVEIPVVEASVLDTLKRTPWLLTSAIEGARVDGAMNMSTAHQRQQQRLPAARIEVTAEDIAKHAGVAAESSGIVSHITGNESFERVLPLLVDTLRPSTGTGAANDDATVSATGPRLADAATISQLQLAMSALGVAAAELQPACLFVGFTTAELQAATRALACCMPGAVRLPVLCPAVTHVIVSPSLRGGAAHDAVSAVSAAKVPSSRILHLDWLLRGPAYVAFAANDHDGESNADDVLLSAACAHIDWPPKFCLYQRPDGGSGADGTTNTSVIGRVASPSPDATLDHVSQSVSRGASPASNNTGEPRVAELRIPDIIAKHGRKAARPERLRDVAAADMAPPTSVGPSRGGSPLAQMPQEAFPQAPPANGPSSSRTYAPPRGSRRLKHLRRSNRPEVHTLFAAMHVAPHHTMSDVARHELAECLKLGGGNLANVHHPPPEQMNGTAAGGSGSFLVVPHGDQQVFGSSVAAPSSTAAAAQAAKRVTVDWFAFCLEYGVLEPIERCFAFEVPSVPREPPPAALARSNTLRGGAAKSSGTAADKQRGGVTGAFTAQLPAAASDTGRSRGKTALDSADQRQPSPHLFRLRLCKAEPGVSTLLCTGDEYDHLYTGLLRDMKATICDEFDDAAVSHVVVRRTPSGSLLDAVRAVAEAAKSSRQDRRCASSAPAADKLQRVFGGVAAGKCFAGPSAFDEVEKAPRATRIVSLDWLEASARAGFFVAEENFQFAVDTALAERCLGVLTGEEGSTAAAAGDPSQPPVPSSDAEPTAVAAPVSSADASGREPARLLSVYVAASQKSKTLQDALGTLARAGVLLAATDVSCCDAVVTETPGPRDAVLYALCSGALIATPSLLLEPLAQLTESGRWDTVSLTSAIAHEWTPSSLTGKVDAITRSIAAACRGCREARARGEPGPFQGRVVVFWAVASAARLAGMIKAGGGVVSWLPTDRRYATTSPELVTHLVQTDAAVNTVVCDPDAWKAHGTAFADDLAAALTTTTTAGNSKAQQPASTSFRTFEVYARDWLLRVAQRREDMPLMAKTFACGVDGGAVPATKNGAAP